MRRDTAIAKLKQAEPALRASGVDALYLFGSVARDDAQPGSDVDVFVEAGEGKKFGFLDFMDAYEALKRTLGEGIQIGYSTREGLSPYVRAEVEKEAIRIF